MQSLLLHTSSYGRPCNARFDIQKSSATYSRHQESWKMKAELWFAISFWTCRAARSKRIPKKLLHMAIYGWVFRPSRENEEYVLKSREDHVTIVRWLKKYEHHFLRQGDGWEVSPIGVYDWVGRSRCWGGNHRAGRQKNPLGQCKSTIIFKSRFQSMAFTLTIL